MASFRKDAISAFNAASRQRPVAFR